MVLVMTTYFAFLTCIWIWQSNGVVVMSGQRRFFENVGKNPGMPAIESNDEDKPSFYLIFQTDV